MPKRISGIAPPVQSLAIIYATTIGQHVAEILARGWRLELRVSVDELQVEACNRTGLCKSVTLQPGPKDSGPASLANLVDALEQLLQLISGPRVV